jgi:CRISPR/Cas system CMR-associated protein Cmr1 (group 7 of RAMP superfamily)
MLNYVNRFNGSWITSINELDFELNMGLSLLVGFSGLGKRESKGSGRD